MSLEAMKQMVDALKELVAQTETRFFGLKHDHVALQNARAAIADGLRAIAEAEKQEPDWRKQPWGFGEKRLYVAEETSPPQRQWVGLTDDEINSVAYNNHPLDGIRTFARAMEAKLKEKNT